MKNDGIISLSNQLADCKISLFGGNIISYKPKHQKNDVFWLGDYNKFDNIQAIRGGVPVCWPRFAEEKLNDHFPRHGFARLSEWKLQKVNIDEHKIETELLLIPDSKFNLDVTAKLNIQITDKLEYSLITTNNGNTEFKFSEALHTYFNVSNRDDIILRGFDGQQYRSSIDKNLYTVQKDLQIKEEFDGAFINHTQDVAIIDEKYNRIISIHKQGSNSTVVWNPNKDLAEMSEGQYKKFICVEPANQGNLYVTLAPKETHIISMTISVKQL